MRMLVALVLGATSCEVLGYNETMNYNMVRPGWEYMTDGLMARSQDATQEPFQPSGPNALCAQSQELTNAAIAAFDLDVGYTFPTSQDRVQTAEPQFDALFAPDPSVVSAQIAHNPFSFLISFATGALEYPSYMSTDIISDIGVAISKCSSLLACVLTVVFLIKACAFSVHLIICISTFVARVTVKLAPLLIKAFSLRVKLLMFYCVVRPVCLLIAYLFTFSVGTVSLPIWLLVITFNALLRRFMRVFGYNDTCESALMMDGDADNADWDARKYPKCRPFHGQKGVAFEKFVQDFGAAMAMELDENGVDLDETMRGVDEGGDEFLANGGAALNAAGTRRRVKRLKLLYGWIYKHVTDLRLREMLDAEARNDGRAAFRLLVTHCRRAITDLEIASHDAKWNEASIAGSVGIKLDSIILFTRYLKGLNARRPVAMRKDANELTKKLLLSITPQLNAQMAADAFKELRADAAHQSFHDATAGTRDFDAAEQEIDETWRALFEAGAIKPAAPLHRTARVEGAALLDGDPDDGALAAGDGRPRKIFNAAEMRAMAICWCCRGLGHLAEQCPSAPGIRPIGTCIDMLRASASTSRPSGGKGRGGGKGDRFGKGRGGSFRPRFGRGFGGRGSALHVNDVDSYVTDNGLALDEEGYVYNADGECIGHLNENLHSESEPAPTDAGKDDGNDDAEDNVHVIDDGDGWVSSLIVGEGDSDCSEASSSSVSSPIMWSWPFASPPPSEDPAPSPLPSDDGQDTIAFTAPIPPAFRFSREVDQSDSFTHHSDSCDCCRPLNLERLQGCMPMFNSMMDSGYDGATAIRFAKLAEAASRASRPSSDAYSPPNPEPQRPEPSFCKLCRRANCICEDGVEDWCNQCDEAYAECSCGWDESDMPTSSVPFSLFESMPNAQEVCPSVTQSTKKSSGWRKTIWSGVAAMLLLLTPPVSDLLLTPSVTAISAGLGVIELESALPMKTGTTIFDQRASPSDLIVDCGATKHCQPDVSALSEITETSPQRYIRVGNNAHREITAVGNMNVKVPTRRYTVRKNKKRVVNGTETMHLTNVLVVPDMPCRLFSSRWGHEHDGIKTFLNDDQCLQLPSGSFVPFKTSPKHFLVETAAAVSTAEGDDADLMHARLGHFSAARINATLTRGSHSFEGIKHDPLTCEACLLNRRRKTVPKSTTMPREYKYFGERVCSDTCGPFPKSPGGFEYAVCFYDCYSKYVAVYYLKASDAAEIKLAHQTFLTDHKRFLTRTVTHGVVDEWHTDNGTGFTATDMDNFCAELGTRRSYSVPYEPTRNANAERVWGILLRPTRHMMAHAGNDTVKEGLWPFAMNQSALIHNSLASSGFHPPMAPLEMLTGTAPTLDIFKTMFCDAYAILQEDEIPTKVSSTRDSHQMCQLWIRCPAERTFCVCS